MGQAKKPNRCLDWPVNSSSSSDLSGTLRIETQGNSDICNSTFEMDPAVGDDSTTEDKNRQDSVPHLHEEINRSSSDALAKALSTMLGSVIRDFDSKAEDTLKSQEHLSSSIDRLTRELDQLLEDAPLPFIMQNAAKISGVRKRVLSLNNLLKSIQKRLDNIDRVLSLGLSQGKDSSNI